MADEMKLGVSTCLLGQPVRYDGGHKRDRYLIDTLGRYMRFVPVCPEVECGLPVPRESMRLVGDPAAPRLVTTKTGRDLTDQMLAWARQKVEALADEELVGFVFRRGSPSSGMERIKVYDDHGVPHKVGQGLFARVFMARFPTIPCEEDGRLRDPAIRESFLERVFTLARWRAMVAQGPTRQSLVTFHATHKLLVMSHDQRIAKEMGRVVAHMADRPLEAVLDEYLGALMESLAVMATPGRHVNVMMHVMGYFKEILSADDKRELLDLMETYRAGHLPLVVPITMLNHYVRVLGDEYLAAQWYLHPHPVELKLRNHA